MKPNLPLLLSVFEHMKARMQASARIDRDSQPLADEVFRNLDWAWEAINEEAERQERCLEITDIFEQALGNPNWRD